MDYVNRLLILEQKFSNFEKAVLAKKKDLPDKDQIQLACQKFGISLAAFSARGRSAHLCISRTAVARELIQSGWTVNKIGQYMSRTPRQIFRMLKPS